MEISYVLQGASQLARSLRGGVAFYWVRSTSPGRCNLVLLRAVARLLSVRFHVRCPLAAARPAFGYSSGLYARTGGRRPVYDEPSGYVRRAVASIQGWTNGQAGMGSVVRLPNRQYAGRCLLLVWAAEPPQARFLQRVAALNGTRMDGRLLCCAAEAGDVGCQA